MMKKVTLLVILIVIFGCSKKIELPENFNRTNLDVGLVIELAKKFEVGFVNPSYYFSKKHKKVAQQLIYSVKPLDFFYTKIKEYFRTRFQGTKFNIKNILLNNVPHLPNTYTGVDYRAPIIHPAIDLKKLKEKLGTRYILLFRIRHLRLELEVRPLIRDAVYLDPVIALYDTTNNEKLYQWYLGTPHGLTFARVKINLGNHENNEKNQSLIRRAIVKIIKYTVDNLTEKLLKQTP